MIDEVGASLFSFYDCFWSFYSTVDCAGFWSWRYVFFCWVYVLFFCSSMMVTSFGPSFIVLVWKDYIPLTPHKTNF
jgi:hypothetical protein